MVNLTPPGGPARRAGSPHDKPRIVIAGGSGYLGRSLANHLTNLNYDVTILSRSAPRNTHAAHTPWDGRTLDTTWPATLNNAHALVNLCGRTVDCIKTPDHCDQILRSRVESTRALGRAMRTIDNPPPVWVQMSTAHIYGDPGPDTVCDEDAALGLGLAPDVARAWEAAFHEGALDTQRKVILRTSFVLGKEGGALMRLKAITRLGAGGTVSHGNQGISWIHERDMNRLFERAITNDTMQGAYLATAPNPVSNKAFMRALRQAMRIPIGLPAPAPLVRLGAPLLMRTDPDLALYGRYCIPRRLTEEGFDFEHPEINAALRDVAGNASR